ncbi:MAG: sensor histidine kinase [Kiritimatiellia bacterium]
MRNAIALMLLGCGLVAVGAVPGYRQDTSFAYPLRGVVSFVRRCDEYFFLRTAPSGVVWRIERQRGERQVEPGELVSVTNGYFRTTYTTRRVNNALLGAPERVDPSLLPAPREVSLRELYRHPLNDPAAADRWGELVSCAGTVRDVNRRQHFTQIQLGEGNLSFQATVCLNINASLPEGMELGAKVRVTGIMLYSPVDDHSRHVMVDFTDVSVLPVDISGVEVLSRAPFWTPARIWSVTGLVVLVLAVCVIWAALLRRAVVRQTARLERSIREKHTAQVEFDAIRRERLRLSYELHDNFQQLLASCQFRLEAAATWIGRNDGKARQQVEKAQDGLVYTQQQLRTALWGMNEESEGPGSFRGLIDYAVGRMAHWQGVVSISSVGTEPSGVRKYSGAFLMILQEAVGNALKHGQATEIRVLLSFGAETVTMRVVDNGCGFDPETPRQTGHLGLENMRRRAAEIGGRCTFESVPARGTAVVVEVKL